ncbi:uncharacterized protein LOC104852388 isoform X2 [Fukomys damarensis]|uniref:uncharacterized protein LOC104852388 isoform X2 n=1 Tax=Fukomys damarensis TaxID=885580 RepID=UPI00053F8742|nr:uncharacterized protein LOC104852388 isoform X2 [Fukomys damarensis]
MAPLVTASPAVSGGLVPVLGGVCRSLQSPYPLLSPEIQMRAPLALQDRDGDLSVDVTVLVAQQLNSTGELVVTPATQVPALQGRGLSSLSQQRAAGLRVATPPLPPGPLAQHRVCYSQDFAPSLWTKAATDNVSGTGRDCVTRKLYRIQL